MSINLYSMLLSDLFIYLFIEASQQDFLAISYDFKVRSIDKHKKNIKVLNKVTQ